VIKVGQHQLLSEDLVPVGKHAGGDVSGQGQLMMGAWKSELDLRDLSSASDENGGELAS